MLSPLIRRPRRNVVLCSKERGFTMAFVAITIVAIISMAALSIDIGTLYEARAEAQRAADAAALTAAQVISASGITGDPANATSSWQLICDGASSPASAAAISVAQQNSIGGVAASTINVYYGTNGGAGPNADCTGAGAAFGINPIVTVNVQRPNLPIFFARIFSLFGSTYSSTSVSASATAEVFNPSNSGSVTSSSALIPVAPRCVKPWIVPNIDPTSGQPFINLTDGSIANPGILPLGKGVIGENFNVAADCHRGRANCSGANMVANPPASTGGLIHYVPALIQGTPVAFSSCSKANPFQEAIGGCDQSTVYACGTLLGAQADLTENPVNPGNLSGDTGTAAQCLIHSASGGQDQLNAASFPFQLQAGSANPLVTNGVVSSSSLITTSNSIVTIPVYDSTAGTLVGTQPQVTIVGFLQVFIKDLAGTGELNVYVMNVAGCGNGKTTAVSSTAVLGTSPVPVRLITPP